MTTSALRTACLAVSRHLLDGAVGLPEEFVAKGIERASTWAKWAATIMPSNAGMLLRGITITQPNFASEQAELDRTLSAAGQTRVHRNGTLNWLVGGELVGLDESFELLVDGARHVHFSIGTSLGGSWAAADRMLAITASKPTSVHVEQFAGSASALLVALTPGKRSMSKTATLMFHDARNCVWGNSRELRKQADELDRLGDDIALRLSKRTKQSLRWCRKLGDGDDHTFTALGALRYGLVDAIKE